MISRLVVGVGLTVVVVVEVVVVVVVGVVVTVVDTTAGFLTVGFCVDLLLKVVEGDGVVVVLMVANGCSTVVVFLGRLLNLARFSRGLSFLTSFSTPSELFSSDSSSESGLSAGSKGLAVVLLALS